MVTDYSRIEFLHQKIRCYVGSDGIHIRQFHDALLADPEVREAYGISDDLPFITSPLEHDLKRAVHSGPLELDLPNRRFYLNNRTP